MALLKASSFVNGYYSIYKVNYLKLIGCSTMIRNFKTNIRLKGTFVERWEKYWQNLLTDYKDVAIDVVKHFKKKPIISSVYISILGGYYYFSQHNPDAYSYRDQLLQNKAKLMQVGHSIRNPKSEKYLTWVEQCYNEGTIRRLNLGIVSFMWLDNFDSASAVYKAICPYLKPRYVTFQQRIIDVGFMDNWWILEHKMRDYDVNESEFQLSHDRQ